MAEFVERPWGGYQIIYEDFGVVAKILTVNPGMRLSLQKHAFRSESWYLVAGDMIASVDGETIEMEIGEVVTVDVGKIHRLSNFGTEVGRVVEIIAGHYDEDDIVRLDDDFGRVND
jgi:mannose-1-phosphate guanylyltransferase/mannose-6-phosphate isomerase